MVHGAFATLGLGALRAARDPGEHHELLAQTMGPGVWSQALGFFRWQIVIAVLSVCVRFRPMVLPKPKLQEISWRFFIS